MDQVKFTKMEDGDVEDYTFLNDHEVEYTKGTADRLLKALVNLDESLSGYQVTRLGHSIQSASRAWRDGADDQMSLRFLTQGSDGNLERLRIGFHFTADTDPTPTPWEESLSSQYFAFSQNQPSRPIT